METIQILPEIRQYQPNEYQPFDFLVEDDFYKYSEDGRAVSEDEYWEKYYIHPDYSYELNNGYLEVKPMTGHDGILLYTWFFELIRNFIKINPVAKPLIFETGFKPLIKKKKSVRKPDIGVILNSNPVPFVSGDFSYSIN